MIFRRLTLSNFRQFEGTHSLAFATDPAKNVTVIHGTNGSGKTTLLNAFTWLLYDATSDDFEYKDRLDSESAFAQLKPEDKLKVSVELEFEDADRVHTVRRETAVLKDSDGERSPSGQTSLRVTYIDDAGEIQEPKNPQNYIEHLLPRPLYPFFFFNGERIERLAGPGAYDEVENGVKVLMDIELFDRSTNHLDGDISRRLRDEIAQHSGDEGQELKAQRDKIEGERSKAGQLLDQHRTNQKSLLIERDTIDAKLGMMPEIARLHAERKAAEESLKVARDQLKNCLSNLAKVVSRDGYLILGPSALTRANDLLTAAHESGELPIKIKRQFVDELLAQGMCICGRTISAGTPEHECVAGWRDRAGSEALEAAVSVTKAEIEPLLNRRQRAIDEIDGLQQQRVDLRKKIRADEELRDELSTQIASREHVEDQFKLETRRRLIEDECNTLLLQISGLQAAVESCNVAISDVDAKLSKVEQADEQAKLAKRRLAAIQAVSGALHKIRNLRDENLRADLSQRLMSVWQRIALKDYECELGDQYHLSLKKRIGNEVAPVRGASTGEKQILSLAFIGALVDKANATFEQYKDDPQRLFRGGKYPIIMDSAFGNLEAEYRRGVASAIPTIAPQVIILVSETQWRVEVDQEISPRIGKQFVLLLQTQKKAARTIRLRNQDLDYVRESLDGYERTEVTEVTV